MRFGKLLNPVGNRVAIYPTDTSGGGGGGAIYSTTVDFTLESYSLTVSFTHAGALTSNKIIMVPSADMPAGLSVDELEMDNFTVAAYVSAADTITAVITAIPGPVRGERNFNYQII